MYGYVGNSVLNDTTCKMTSEIQDFSMTIVIKRFKCVQPIYLHCHVACGGGGGGGRGGGGG